jgi:hypothetical protein
VSVTIGRGNHQDPGIEIIDSELSPGQTGEIRYRGRLGGLRYDHRKAA